MGSKNGMVSRDGGMHIKQEKHKGCPVEEKTGAEGTGDWFKKRRSLFGNSVAQRSQGKNLRITLQR